MHYFWKTYADPEIKSEGSLYPGLALRQRLARLRRDIEHVEHWAARVMLLGQRGARLKSALLPQYLSPLAGLILYVIGMTG
jgi:hypothetical protein